MNKQQQERALILLKATINILDECEKGAFVKNVFEQTATWDGVECDGYCLHEELKELIEDIKSNT